MAETPAPWESDPVAPTTPANAAPWDADPVAESQGQDILKSAGAGVAKGAISLGGAGGDAREFSASLVNKISKWLGYELPQETVSTILKYSFPLLSGPTSEQGQKAVEKFTGEFYKPQTELGEYAQTFGEFLPGAAFGPGGVARRVVGQAVIPAVASEAAGQATKGTPYEQAARTVAAITGGVAGTRALTPRTRGVAAPSIGNLENAQHADYRALRGADVEYNSQRIAKVAENIEDDLRIGTGVGDGGITIRNAPETVGVLRALQKPTLVRDGGFGLTSVRAAEFESARQELVQAARSIANPRERVAASRAIELLDNYLANIPANDVLRGNVDAVRRAAESARGNTAALKKAQAVAGKMELADLNTQSAHSGQNMDNATRQALKQLIRPDKAGRSQAQKMGFTAEEIAAIRRVVRSTSTGNLLRGVGKLAPRGAVTGLAHGIMAVKTGGASIPFALAAEVAKFAGDRMTRANLRRLDEMVRANSPLGRDMGSRPAGRGPRLSAPQATLISGLLSQQ